MTTLDPTILQARLEEAYQPYIAAMDRIVHLSLLVTLAEVRQQFPNARYVTIDTTDQDFSGSLIPSAVLDADESIIAGDDLEEWDALTDRIGPPLGNLDDSNQHLWLLACDPEQGPDVRVLDLTKIELLIEGD